jgi:cell wall-associated NlpC family hydrolase/prophage tail gpP-like protein
VIQARALIQVETGSSGFRQFPTKLIEAFTIDGAMDTDADAFSIDLGTSDMDLVSLCTQRDNEVKLSIFTKPDGRSEIEYLASGIADTVDFDTGGGLLSIAGRDITCTATDSQAPPGERRSVRPKTFITKEANALGITKLKLADTTALSRFYRDGSESYWESWYRLYRKKKMWIWAEPDGYLIGDKLNYSSAPSYFFGTPSSQYPKSAGWIPVTFAAVVSNKQGRIGEQWVFGERGDIGFVSKVTNPKISSWTRKPLKIMTSTDAKNKNDAQQEAFDEIFEGDVGALEIVVHVPLSQSGQIVRQNNMAQVNIPAAGLSGTYFVVGCRLIGGVDGYRQEVRLREKNYAISRRVPDDPELVKDPSEQAQTGAVSDILRGQGIRWPNAFAAAAQEFHDGWPMGLFLSVLLAICDHETGFRNVRFGGDTEWYPKPPSGENAQHINLQDVWRRLFANHTGNPYSNPPNKEAAVGPMQLLTRGFKEWADEYGGKHDEYEGGRWNPESNIRASARAFLGKLSGVDPSKANNIWIGVERYHGAGNSSDTYYRNAIFQIWERKYKGISSSITDAGNIPAGPTTNVTVPDDHGHDFQVRIPNAAPADVKEAINYALRQRGKPYVFGGVGPSAFDCSGLVWAAYKAAGIGSQLTKNTGRPTTYSMVAAGSGLARVAKSALLPGDILFFASGSDVHHCGLYLNDSHMIQAPHTGDVVKISAINSGWYRDHYFGARRVVDWGGRGRTSGD